MMDFTYKDGEWIEGAQLGNRNRAFMYADGCFESFLLVNGRCTGWQYRATRLKQTLHYLRISGIGDLDVLRSSIQAIAHERGIELARVRLTCFRGGDGRYLPQNDLLEMTLQLDSMDRSPFNLAPPKLVDFGKVVLPSHASGNYKLIAKHWQVLAAKEAHDRGLDDLILLNDEGFVSEFVSSNLFLSIDGQVYTPSLASGCLSGATRAALLDYPTVKERHLTLADVEAADYVFASNSIQGVVPVILNTDKFRRSVDLRSFAQHLAAAFEVN